MEILGLEKLSMVDYGDLCCAVVFTGGCNFKCPFCHNSSLVEGDVQPLDTQDVFDYLVKRKGFLDGVVVSGGEPTIHSDLPDFIKSLKDIGYKVKLDTNGTNYEMLKKLVDNGLVDFVAMDIKNSPALYPETCGVKGLMLTNIEKSINLLKSGVVDYEFRTTLVKQFHIPQSVEEIGKLVSGAKIIYLQKFVDNGTTILDGLTEVDKTTALQFKTILEKYVQNVSLRGY